MAIIIETCPRCGAVLHDIVLNCYPPIPKKECFSCGWSWMGEPEEVIYQPFGGNCVSEDNVEHSMLNINIDWSNVAGYKLVTEDELEA